VLFVNAVSANKGGRPPKGLDAQGRPVAVTKAYQRLNLRIPPRIRQEIDLLVAVEGVGAAGLIERALDAYAKALPSAKKKALDQLRAARRVTEHT